MLYRRVEMCRKVYASYHSLIVKSFSIEAEAMMPCLGWVCPAAISKQLHNTKIPTATASTVSGHTISDSPTRQNAPLTPVPFKHLHNFAALQVPYVDPGILAATHYILAVGRDKSCKKTVCAVGMPCVCLHTARILVIPESDSGILRSSQDESRVRRKLDVGTASGIRPAT